LTLGHGLVEAGHEVRLVTHAMFEDLARDSGVDFVGAPGRGMREIIESEAGQQLMRSVGNPLTLTRRVERLFGEDVDLLYRAVLEAAGDVDAMLCYPATFPALDVAERLGLPVVQVHHVPAVPTKVFPAAANFVHRESLGSVGNRLSYSADTVVTSLVMGRPANTARRRVLGTGRSGSVRALRRRARFAGAVVGVSPSVLPPPADWPDSVTTCGYWWPRAIDAPPLDDVAIEFLNAGGPTVFFTLGSTTLDDPGRTTDLVVAAARDAGVRLVLQSGWGGLGEGVEAEDVLVVGDLAYPELFDLVSALVHHGGAGTTALGLKYGRPSLAIPAIADQFFWGHRMHALGVGPEPLAFEKLERDLLAARLRALVNERGYQRNAASLANRIAEEDGVAVAVEAIEASLIKSRK
jgi:UDP:flavonoid glycosyltransferase YjiC (YdhE family)